MGKRNWFVKPEVVRLELSDGEWIEIKKRLTAGEQRQVTTAGMKSMNTAGMDRESRNDAENTNVNINIDWTAMMGMARAVMYLTDWSLRDVESDKPVELTPDAIRALDPDAFTEIDEAIDKHIESMEREKKATAGEPKLKVI